MSISLDIKHIKRTDDHRGKEQAVSTQVADTQEELQAANKKRKREKTVQKQKTQKTTQSRKMSRGLGDVKRSSANTQPPKYGSTQSEGQDGPGKGLYDGFGDTWEPDPLTLFMFENAPVLIRICQESQEAMAKAQLSQTKAQADTAKYSSQAMVKKGQSQASQQEQMAAGEFAQMGLAAFQGALQMRDFGMGDEVMNEELESQDDVINQLDKGTLKNEDSVEITQDSPAEATGRRQESSVDELRDAADEDASASEGALRETSGDRRERAQSDAADRRDLDEVARRSSRRDSERSEHRAEAQGASEAREAQQTNHPHLSEEQKAAIKSAGRRFTRVQQAESEKIYSEREEAKISKVRRSPLGPGRSKGWVTDENQKIADKYACKKAYNQVFEGEVGERKLGRKVEKEKNFTFEAPKTENGEVVKDPATGKPIMEEKTMSYDDLKDLLNDNGNVGVEARQELMKTISGEDEGGKLVPHSGRMRYLRDWDGGTSLRNKMLRDYAGTKEGSKMRSEMDKERNVASQKAQTESNLNSRTLQTRQLLFATLGGQAAMGIANYLQQQYLFRTAAQDATAQLEQSISGMHSQAKSSEDAFIQGQARNMEGIYEWFQNLHGQLISAQASAASA